MAFPIGLRHTVRMRSGPGMCGAGHFSAGRGGARVKIRGAEWGGARVKICGAGRGKKTRKSTDPKIRQKCVFAIGRFVMRSGVFKKENIASSFFKRVISCTQDQMLAFHSFSSSEMMIVGIMKRGIKF